MEEFDCYMLNKIFTIPYFDKMLDKKTVPEPFIKCVKRYVKDGDGTVGDVISEIYHYMDEKYRNEYFYKNTIFNELLIKKHDLYHTAALSELPIGGSKADFIMINGRGIVYEIKTDLDNLIRLEKQIQDYYKVFSYVYVVVGNKQLSHVKEFLKNLKVGIYELTPGGKLLCRKKAYCNKNLLSHKAMFEVLRKAEFETIVRKFYNKLPEVNSFQYYRECLKWIEKINICTFQKEVMNCLKSRTLLVFENSLEERVPYELRFYAYFSKKTTKNYKEIEDLWNARMEG